MKLFIGLTAIKTIKTWRNDWQMDKRKDWLETDGIITTLIDWYMEFFSFV